MKKGKKLLALLMVAMLAVSAASCSSNETTSSSESSGTDSSAAASTDGEEKLDEMKLERAIERAMIEGTDEAVEEAERIKRQNDSPDIQMTDMVDLADSADLKKSVDQNLGDIKSSMKVLEADLKGIKVDEKA